MKKIRIGYIEYLNCLPIYYALEEGSVNLEAKLVKGPPTKLNRMFLEGQLDITPISSIEYARNPDKVVILPDISISADGNVESIFLFSKIPVTELEGHTVALTTSSATSVVLLKILFDHYYHVKVNYVDRKPDLPTMLKNTAAALLIGDDAILAREKYKELAGQPLIVTDLGEVWKKFTGMKMVYALWVIRQGFVDDNPGETAEIAGIFRKAKEIGLNSLDLLAGKAAEHYNLPKELFDHYYETIRYDFGEEEQTALLTYYDYAYKSGLIPERVKLRIWGENIG
ncbi:menaquinone biosynthetic enzyme MqnA/MqnD family protein [Thermincola potens]|uniref:Chorismate dehydratase n=1 Tax=Thermincola potens (strain JR) TaxID=635013 RepID=D5X7Q0_THEPJ|nr:menaquinone biosynthesis protein [Thermincola potens]ADG82620.1 protein of unknown function DUF178 [Thermincola potens JR]